MNALDYFLKANLYGLLFAASYWLLLRRHTFFSLNRLYLIGSALLSLALPLVSLPTQAIDPLPVGLIALPMATAPAEAVADSPDWEQIGWIVYGLIALGFVARFLVRTTRLLRLIRRSPKQVQGDYVLVRPNDATMPTFSFFQYLVLNPADAENELIIQHELVHVRQHHSVDVVILGLLQALFWACPMLWLLNRLLRQVHEFLADKQASRPAEYAQFLVAYSFGLQRRQPEPGMLTNNFFNPSLLKQRITMLQQKATTRWALGKYVLIAPLVFGLLAMTTAREDITAIVSRATGETLTVSGRVLSSVDGKGLPGAMVLVAATGKGTPTDAQGRYTLKQVSGQALLSVSFVGFQTVVLPLDNRTTIDVALVPTDPDELPTMGATSVYKAIKPNPKMPVRTPPSAETITRKSYTAVEEPAVFPTGIPGLMQYVAQALRYPAKAKAAGIQGKVLVEFMVLPSGAIGSATIKKGLSKECDAEALRIVRQMPHWIPGQQNGQPVATQFVLPIQFALEKKEDKRTGWLDGMPVFGPTGSPIGDFPTTRSGDYPYQPRLAMTIVPASKFRPDTTPQPKATTISIHENRPLLSPPPLYIIDGIEMNHFSSDSLNPKNIESISVLKGESATGTYGEKGKNGVILITTKKK
ncbi:M56 family metallopeptidase [Spirosoma koreense]